MKNIIFLMTLIMGLGIIITTNAQGQTQNNTQVNQTGITDYLQGFQGSLDIYIQNASPGADKESNWLPAAEGAFNMNFRMYLLQPQILNGTWQLPFVQNVG